MSPDGRVWHGPRAAPLSGAPQPRHSTTPRAHLHHPAVHIAPAQPTSPHWTASTVAPCGEGALVGGWHAGTSPSTPIMRWVMNRGSSSASFARPYTPLGRSRGTLISRLAETKIELHVEFGGAIFSFELVHCIDFTVSRSGELLSRAPARTFHVATPLCLRLSCRLVPTSRAQISRFLPACLRRKQAHQPSCPSRTGGGVFGRCR